MLFSTKRHSGNNYGLQLDFDDKHIGLTKEVLDCLKGSTTDVPDPNRKWNPFWDIAVPAEDNIELHNRFRDYLVPKNFLLNEVSATELGNIEISVLEWLPIACKRISFDNAYGRYSKNSIFAFQLPLLIKEMATIVERQHKSEEDLFSFSTLAKLHKTDSLAGEIEIAREFKKSDDGFRLLIAHEVMHAINNLQWIYPAMINYEGFLNNIVGGSDFDQEHDVLLSLPDELLDSPIERTHLILLESMFGKIVYTWSKGYSKFVLTLSDKEKTSKQA